MKATLLCVFLVACSARAEEETALDDEMELLERLVGKDKIQHLLSGKEVKHAREHARKLGEETVNPLPEDKDSQNTYITLEQGKREVTNITCKRDFMQLFSLYGQKITHAYVTDIADHKYCFSDFSCCTTDHFSHMMKTFALNVNRVRKRLRPVIELFTFFRGRNLRHYIKARKNDPKCKYILFDERKNSINLYDDDTFKKYSTLVVEFISQIRSFVDLKEELFGNMLCSLCAPNQQKNIVHDKENNKLIFKFSSDVCNLTYHAASFEVKLQFIYKYLVRRIADFVECASGLTLKGFMTARTIVFPHEEIHLSKDCYNNFNSDMPHCLDFCKPELDVFKYEQHSGFTRHIKKTLRLFYHIFGPGGEEIEDYYKKVFGYGFHAGLETQPIVIFSEKSPMAMKYNIKDYEIDFSEKGGINPFISPISQTFWNEVNHIIEKSGKA